MNTSRYIGSETHESGIAIVGMSGRFPGANTVNEFWHNLCEGKIALKQYSKQEINDAITAHDYASTPHLMKQVRSGTWVGAGFHFDDSDKFDAEFFGYTPSEAELLDPQQRIFLETAWAAVEDAGYIPDEYPGVVGVFGGANLSRYFLYNIFSNREIMYSTRDLTAGIGNEPDYVTNRVAYKLNFTGPSVSVQTACSTSLVAIHMASQALLAGECDFCLAGGVMVNAPGSAGYLYQEGSMTSPDGHIRTFDKDASGTVFSEGGVGVVCLKRVEDAIADGDQIYGVLIGSAVGNDGNHKAGYTAPGIDGQVSVIREAIDVAGISPREISYVEAHGTGTPLGDPIEFNALSKAYREDTEDTQFCAIGSLKPNVGHLAPAAGVASVIKTSLALKHGLLPPSLNYKNPNPQIDFESSPFFVNTEKNTWQVAEKKIASVSSFGIGGTNAHVIIEEAPAETEREIISAVPMVFPVSARTNQSLSRSLENLKAFLVDNPTVELRDVSHTLKTGRKGFKRRASLYAEDTQSLIQQIEKLLDSKYEKAVLRDDEPVVFMFSGQGSQYASMCKDLYQDKKISFDVFSQTIDQCFAKFDAFLSSSLKSIVFDENPENSGLLRETRIVQPILFSFELALAKQLNAFGIDASAMIGHSIGEYVAAHLADVFDFDTAIKLVYMRGKLMQSMPEGSMLSLPLNREGVEKYLSAEIALAADNGPANTVLSGKTDAIDALIEQLEKDGITSRKLVTSHAFHSTMMNPILAEFRELLTGLTLNTPTKPYISNVSGDWVTDEQATSAEYWAKHLAGTVCFRAGIEKLLSEGYKCFLEVGPSNALTTFARKTIAQQKAGAKAVQLVRHIKDEMDDREYLIGALQNLWCLGLSIDWDLIIPVPDPRRISLPTYAFERVRHWVDAKKSINDNSAFQGKRENLDSWMYVPSWKKQSRFRLADLSALQQRKLLLISDSSTGLLVDELSACCDTVITVSPGSSFERVSETSYRLDVTQVEHFERLLEQTPIDTVLYTLCLENDTASLEQKIANGFYVPLSLYQAIGQYSSETPIRVLTVTSGLNDVFPGEQIDPVKSLLMGIHMCAGQEYPTILGRNLDFPCNTNIEESSTPMIEALLSELSGLIQSAGPLVSPQDKFSAYRSGYRWVANIEGEPLSEPANIQINGKGTYLITGGLGGLGLEFADHLVQLGARKIALLGRSQFPDSSQWDAWLADKGQDDQTSKKIAKLKSIENKGAEISVFSADITSAEQLKGVVAQINQKMGNICGVIHSAGVAGSGVMQLKTQTDAANVIAPKVYGTYALHEALSEQSLDFMMLFSSLFSIIGGVGQVDYSAANNFLDAFARWQRNSFDCPVVSINWGGFSEVGMAANMGFVPSAAKETVQPTEKELAHPYLYNITNRDDQSFVVTSYLNHEEQWALQEHKIEGQGAMPGTGLLELVRAAFQQQFGNTETLSLENVYFLSLLTFPEDEIAKIEVEFIPMANNAYSFECYRIQNQTKITFVSGDIFADHHVGEAADLSALKTLHTLEHQTFDSNTPQTVQDDNGFLSLGERWQVLQELDFSDKGLFARLALPTAYASDTESFYWHPSLLDMATGPVTGHLLQRMDLDIQGEYLPFSYGKLESYAALPAEIYSQITYLSKDDLQKTLHFDITIFDTQGNACIRITDFILKQVPERRMESPVANDTVDFMDDSTSPNEGRAIFNRILANLSQPQWIVSTQDLPGLIERTKTELAESLNGNARDKSVISRDDDLIAPRNEVEAILVDVFENVLGITPISIDDNFFDLGTDSVVGIQVVSHAKGRGLSIKPNQLFKHQTIAELAEVVGAAAGGNANTLPMTHTALQSLPLSTGKVAEQWSWLSLSSPEINQDQLISRLDHLLQQNPCLNLIRSGEKTLETGNISSSELIQVLSGNNAEGRAEIITGELEKVDSALLQVFYLPEQKQNIVLAFHTSLGLTLNLAEACLEYLTATQDDLTKAKLNASTDTYEYGLKEDEKLYYKKQVSTVDAVFSATGDFSNQAHLAFSIAQYSELNNFLAEHELSYELLLLSVLFASLREVGGQQSSVYANLIRSGFVDLDGRAALHRYKVPFSSEIDLEKSTYRQLNALRSYMELIPRAGISFSLYQQEPSSNAPVSLMYLGQTDNAAMMVERFNSHLNLESPVQVEAYINDGQLFLSVNVNQLVVDAQSFANIYKSIFETAVTELLTEEQGGLSADSFANAELSDDDFDTLLNAFSEEV